MIKLITYKEAIDFLLPRHYSGRKPQIKWAFGYYDVTNTLVAVITVGKPASNSLCKGIFGVEHSSMVYELNRVCVDGTMPKPLSHFIAYCLQELKRENVVLISYADTEMGHIGTIYKATNWIYTGVTKARTDKYTKGNKHSRHYDKTTVEEYRKVRSSKHRYIYFCTSKTIKKSLLKKLNYKTEQYPEGKSQKYILGEFLKPNIIKI